MSAGTVPRQARPASRFGLWLGAASASTLGDAVTYFALSWAATAFGAGTASAVMTVEGVPLVLLVLVGGAVGDRFGIWRTMVVCDLVMMLVMSLFLVLVLGAGTIPLWSLFALAVASATASALRRPSDGVFPRLFGTGPELERRTALVGSMSQIARIAGPASGGVLLGVGGMALTSGLDALSFATVAATLLMVRPPAEHGLPGSVRTPTGRSGSRRRVAAGAVCPDAGSACPCTSRGQPPARPAVLREIATGVIEAVGTPGMTASLVSVVCLAGAVLPLVMLCLPLLARERGWSATTTGALSAAWTVGGLLVTILVARRGSFGRTAALAGPLLAVCGLALLDASRSAVAAFAGMAGVGVGTSLLTTYLLPAMIRLAPPDKLARFSSLMQLAQMLPTTLVMPVLGLMAGIGSWAAVGAVGVLLLLTTISVRAVPTMST